MNASLPAIFAYGTLVAASLAFPAFVAAYPDRFGAGRIASPISGSPAKIGEGTPHRFGALAPLVERAPPRIGVVDPARTGAISRSLPPSLDPPTPRAATIVRSRWRLVARMEGVALVDAGTGPVIVRVGERLPDGSVLVASGASGLRVRRADSPAQAETGRMVNDGGTDADRTDPAQ